MLTYCVKCRKKPENLHLDIFKTKTDKIIMQPKRSVCGIKKSRFGKEQEPERLLSKLGIKTSLNKIPLLKTFFKYIEMNEIVNKFLLAVEKIKLKCI